MTLLKNDMHDRRNAGFSLIEVVLYVAFFIMISTMSMTALFQTVKAFSSLRVSRDIDDSAVKIMERMTRDIKSSVSVDLSGSTFNVSPGRLTLSTMSASGTPLTIEYYVLSSALHIKENGVDKGALMSSKTNVDSLVFHRINSGTTVGIKIDLHLSSTRGTVGDVVDFYNTSVLRGSY